MLLYSFFTSALNEGGRSFKNSVVFREVHSEGVSMPGSWRSEFDVARLVGELLTPKLLPGPSFLCDEAAEVRASDGK